MLPTARIIHISHNDLDGIAAQFVISRTFYNVKWFNCDYKDIEFTISQALKQIKMETLAGSPPKLLLVTDINLTLEVATYLDAQIKGLPSPPKLVLLDHHATGAECAKKFSWYQLDTTCCATRITYQWVKELLPEEIDDYLDKLSSLVNVTDLWQQQDPHFGMANLIADLMFEKGLMVTEMEEQNRNYLFHLIDNCFKRFQQGKTVMQVERSIYQIRLDYLLEAGLDQAIVEDESVSLEGKYHYLVLEFISANKPPVIEIDGYKVAIFYRWQGTMYQHVSSMFLQRHSHIDIAIRVGSNARLSIRTRKQDIDVGVLARRYFGGGGHPQAAGGSLNVREIKNVAIALSLLKKATSN